MEKKDSVISWFPGHMTKALREMEREIKNVDIIFYCLDARAPESCLNPKLSQMCGNKKIVYVLTKADLVDGEQLKKFKDKLTTKNTLAVCLDSTQTNTSKFLLEKAERLLQDKIEKASDKGLNYVMRAMVVGVPNVGKSTLINNFCKKAKTLTGDKPGVTKGKQWVEVTKNLLLLDTPGTLWPSFDDQKVGKRLAYIGSIKSEILDLPDLAFGFISDIVKKDKSIFENRYNIKIEDGEETISIFDKICLSRKCVCKGNEIDYDRGAVLILDDFRKARLGKIILDECK